MEYACNADLLGKACVWVSTQTEEERVGFVVAVRIDNSVQVAYDKHLIPDGLPWRPLNAITILSFDTCTSAVGSGRGTKRTMEVGGETLDCSSYNRYKLFVNGLRGDLSPECLKRDFNAYHAEYINGGRAAILSFENKDAAYAALLWNDTRYVGLRIEVKWYNPKH